MKKITLFTFLLINIYAFAQTKTTGIVALSSNLGVKLDLNNTTSIATITITSLQNSWYGLGFDTTGTPQGNGMTAGIDCVVLRSATNFSDSKFVGSQNPAVDAIQNWTIVTNTVSGTIRTIVATRAFNTGDANDYVFNYAASAIDFIYASPGNGIFSVAYHGGSRGYGTGTFTVLGTEDFSLNATTIFPNPSNGSFNVQTKTNLNTINIYSQVGQFVKTILVDDKSKNVNVSGLSTGIYLLELKNESEKSWKKIIIE